MSAAVSELTIAVTGVGAIIGQGIVRSLRASGRAVRLVGIDRSDRSPGPYVVDVFEKKPEAAENNPDYLEYWARIIQRHGIQLVMPGLEVDMVFLNQHRDWFEALGVSLVLNTPQLTQQTRNKWSFGRALAAIGYPVIPSSQPDTWAEALQALGPPPLLLKPLVGNGSRGIVKLEDERDFEYWREKASGEWMLQRIVGNPDEEYTVGIFGLGNGSILGPIIFRRRLSNAGNTQEAEVVLSHTVLESAVEALCTYFCPVGPTNLQFRVEGDIAYLLEINPRFSSSNSLRTGFGFNEAAMSIDFFFHGKTPEAAVCTEGIAWRYSEDFLIHARHPV